MTTTTMMQRGAKRCGILLTIPKKNHVNQLSHLHLCKSTTFWCKNESQGKNSHAKNSSAADSIGWWSLCVCCVDEPFTSFPLPFSIFNAVRRSRKRFCSQRGASDYANQLLKKICFMFESSSRSSTTTTSSKYFNNQTMHEIERKKNVPQSLF